MICGDRRGNITFLNLEALIKCQFLLDLQELK